MEHLLKVQKQFGPAASDYVSCPIQSGDFTIARLIQMLEPKINWRVLDVATGGGHTAVALSPLVKEVVATDVTREMLSQAKLHAEKNQCFNISFEFADATDLPYEDESFDLVTCRLAAHHFEDVPKFLRACYRLLRPSGILAIVDSHLPSNQGGDYINKIQRIHDPSHVKCLSREEWQSVITDSGFHIRVVEEGRTVLNFDNWASRARVSLDVNNKLKKMMLEAPVEASNILDIDLNENGEMKFYFQRIIIIATKI